MLTSDDPIFEEDFAALYDSYAEKIYNLAYRMTGNHQDSEDVTQETFIQVYQHIGQFRGESQLYTWIYAITKNLCYRLLKQKKKSSFSSMERLVHSVQSEASPDVFSDREKRILQNQVKEGCFTGLLRCLSFYQRMAFILHVLLRLSIRDVSHILEKSEGSTKVLIHRARKNLKAFLCKNCSLYSPGNPCRCENLIHFSLAQDWIQKPIGHPREKAYLVAPEFIQSEIQEMRRVTTLYQSLIEQTPSDDFARRMRNMIQTNESILFSRQKV